MSMDGIIQQMIILFILMFVGFLISKAKVITAEANQYICKMVVTIGVPGLLLSSVADGSPFHDQVELLEVIGVCTLINVAVVLISWLVVKVLRIQNSKNVYKFMTIFPNAGFIGFPVINAIFGSEALIYAAIFQLPHNLLMYTYGIYLMSGGSKNEIDLKKLINPCVVAALAAILFCVFDIKLSYIPEQVCNYLGQITTPLGMVIIGSSLAGVDIKQIIKNVTIIPFTLIKLFVLPIVVYYIAHFVGASDIISAVVAITMGMPCATNTVIFANIYNQKIDVASTTVFFTTVVSIVSIPIVCLLLF